MLYEDRFLLIRARARMGLGMTVLVTYGDGPANDDGSREAPAASCAPAPHVMMLSLMPEMLTPTLNGAEEDEEPEHQR